MPALLFRVAQAPFACQRCGLPHRLAQCATPGEGLVLALWAPESNLVVRVNRAIDDQPGIQQEAICYQWFKQQLILIVSKPSISQWSQIKEDTVEPSVPAREFNLKAYAAIT